ncbi:MAG: YCF48-related protein [Albidovulum sp.]|nr:YCF48-related protein [Albidovulum sp.]
MEAVSPVGGPTLDDDTSGRRAAPGRHRPKYERVARGIQSVRRRLARLPRTALSAATPARVLPEIAARAATAIWLAIAVGGEAAADGAVAAPLASKSLLLDGAVAGSRLVVVGDRGHILVSSDNGSNWKQASVPTRVLLTAVHMHDERTGWAVGHDAVILRTVDGGETWKVLHQAPEEELPLLDVWFRDERSGYAVGAYGYFLATDDGGENWEERAISEDDFHLNALLPAAAPNRDSQRLFIAAEAGVAYRSDDGGETWRELPSPYGGSWFGGLAFDDNRVLLAGLRGNAFLSADGGETWTRTATNTRATLTSAIQLRPGLVLLTGLEGIVLTSRDGGRSVSTHRLQTRKGISSALQIDERNVLLIGEFGIERFFLEE